MSRISRSLNFMYKMEQFAKRICLVQRGAFTGSDIGDKLTASSVNEQTRVDLLRVRILDLKIGLSSWGFLFKFTAVIVGAVTMVLGKQTIMRADVFVEQRAIKDYRNYVKTVGFNEKTTAMLEKIIADEVKHIETWSSLLAQLKGKKQAHYFLRRLIWKRYRFLIFGEIKSFLWKKSAKPGRSGKNSSAVSNTKSRQKKVPKHRLPAPSMRLKSQASFSVSVVEQIYSPMK
jgi:bacterioferritin (cytochrome b1)